eukprot:TRINITY_DN14558_c0_g3_i6.p1 TRINITY_DN14558_c0_g3~~TRINITY_DN14558_c0_g3_i6.p1  ORF type:complete len:362 (-),score=41.07 TRINITY_DN14558_c0_g3_i6:23-1108(-)
MKLESARSKKNKKQVKSLPKQTLEGHSGNVSVAIWNEFFQKLTTSDSSGLIIVWMRHNGVWYEEMINSKDCQVQDMKWTADGQKICIAYSDGSVIVGTVDGNRLWAKDLGLKLAYTEWSPDQRSILFATDDGQVKIYDSLGSPISTLPIYAVSGTPKVQIVGLEWFKHRPRYNAHIPSLALCYDNGKAQIMRSDRDDNPVLLDTGLSASAIKWNHNGSVLAIAGSTIKDPTKDSPKEDNKSHCVQFYSPFGKHLRTLNVPGKGINALAWDGDGLRVAMAVDSNILLANVRPDYEWGYFANTVVYSFSKQNRTEDCMAFWDIEAGECHIKYVKQLIGVRAGGEIGRAVQQECRDRSRMPSSA